MRRWRRGAGLALVVVVVVVVAGGCSSKAAAPLPPAPAVVKVSMREYAVVPRPAVVAKGRVVLEVANRGKRNHRLLIIPLPKDFPPVLEQVRGGTRRFVEPLGTLPNTAPGRTRSIALDLAPGRYGLVCPLNEPGTNEAYSKKGMAAEVRVR